MFIFIKLVMLRSVGGLCSGHGTVILLEKFLASIFGFYSEFSANVPSFVVKGEIISSFGMPCLSLTIFLHNLIPTSDNWVHSNVLEYQQSSVGYGLSLVN